MRPVSEVFQFRDGLSRCILFDPVRFLEKEFFAKDFLIKQLQLVPVLKQLRHLVIALEENEHPARFDLLDNVDNSPASVFRDFGGIFGKVHMTEVEIVAGVATLQN